MRQKDNLEQLYRERYQNLETPPREDLWANIAARLPEKEGKNRIIPLWYRIAGVAAVISLLAIIGIGYLKPVNTVTTKVVYLKNSQDNNFFNISSEEFNQSMFTTAELLKSIRAETLTLQNLEKFSYPSENSAGNINRQPVILAANPELMIAGITTGEFSTSQKLNTSMFSPAEAASAEDNLKDLQLEAAKGEALSHVDSEPDKEQRFQLKTTAAAVYFDNLGAGNAIDNQFAGNKGEGDISFSYGIAVAYKISEKLSVRSGVNRVDLSYNTRDVSYGAAISATAVENTEARSMSLASPVMGSLNQSLGFFEVPLELKYALINKKIGLNLIGGASTLFLNENKLRLEAGMASTSLGEAANLNEVSFSTNVGVGVDYNISPQFQLNLEPIFKYQINTFSSTNEVKPYYFGIYSGLSFRF